MADTMPGLDRNLQFTPNDFDSSSMHTRHVLASQQRTCETARRALLSQGYVVNTATPELVAGRKYYQPHADVHYAVEMRVVCAPEGLDGTRTSAFASALQDRYVIKKVNNSASLGVGGLGSVSVPVSAIDDTLVKVGSETITDAQFYQRFFQLFERYVVMAPPATAALQLPLPAMEDQAGQAPPAQPQAQPQAVAAHTARLDAPQPPQPDPAEASEAADMPGVSDMPDADGRLDSASPGGDVPPMIRQLMGQ